MEHQYDLRKMSSFWFDINFY